MALIKCGLINCYHNSGATIGELGDCDLAVVELCAPERMLAMFASTPDETVLCTQFEETDSSAISDNA
jgi:hypothetical protein